MEIIELSYQNNLYKVVRVPKYKTLYSPVKLKYPDSDYILGYCLGYFIGLQEAKHNTVLIPPKLALPKMAGDYPRSAQWRKAVRDGSWSHGCEVYNDVLFFRKHRLPDNVTHKYIIALEHGYDDGVKNTLKDIEYA